MTDNLKALRDEELDVAQMFEPYASMALKAGIGSILHAASARGPTTYTTFLATRGGIGRNRDAFAAMVRAVRRTAVYSQSYFARDGGLLSYGIDQADAWRRAASYVDRILRGAKPGDLPVQFPTKFEMVVNRKTATALGLAVPLSILLRADEVIE
jgi:ABC-type nitrate/sulfonate/bicarbonate transport system substrate-binding protein